MAIIDISIIPVGTNSTSVSEYVAEIHMVLEKHKESINYQLTPMNTVIEGELPNLFKVIQEMHEVPFNKGAARVATTIRIDDRRDKKSTIAGKLESVEAKLNELNNK